MDDLNQQINQILSDPQSMRQIQNMISSLGLNGTSGGPSGGSEPREPSHQPPSSQSGGSQAGGFDPAALAGMLGSLGLGGGAPALPPQNAPPQSQGGITPEMLQMVSRIAPILNQVNREDDSTRLLRALRPLLGPARQKKLDEAVKILQMMRLLPLLKESGLFSGLLSGLL